ncbi:hypothetical protein D3C72_2249910 [compost metagenome]
MLGTAAVAREAVFALLATARQARALVLAEAAQRHAGGQLPKRLLHDVAQAVFGIDIVVAGIEVAIVFECQAPTAGLREDA